MDGAAASIRNVADLEVAGLLEREQAHAVRTGYASAADKNFAGLCLGGVDEVLQGFPAGIRPGDDDRRILGKISNRGEVFELVLGLAKQDVGDQAGLERQQIVRVSLVRQHEGEGFLRSAATPVHDRYRLIAEDAGLVDNLFDNPCLRVRTAAEGARGDQDDRLRREVHRARGGRRGCNDCRSCERSE